MSWREGLEGFAQEPRCQTLCPLVKVSEHKASAAQIRIEENVFAHQAFRLVPALYKSGAQMDVEDVQCSFSSERQVCSQNAAPLTLLRDVDVLPREHRETAECQVAISATPQGAICTKARGVIRKCAGDLPGLIES